MRGLHFHFSLDSANYVLGSTCRKLPPLGVGEQREEVKLIKQKNLRDGASEVWMSLGASILSSEKRFCEAGTQISECWSTLRSLGVGQQVLVGWCCRLGRDVTRLVLESLRWHHEAGSEC